jgi:UDP-N-acetylglucosamine--N-acetylmuramyl-(pentapeptide) pyrophosphoryl-undecaprenol N-acetylglucosamine transferase
VTELITELFEQPETLVDMAKASLNAANSDASQKVATLCQQLSQTGGTELRNNEEKI